ncbi:MAG: tetratricopeptide repeat protein [Polyangiales bacterium]
MHPSQMEEIVRRLVADPNDQAALGAAYADGQRDPRGYATLLERVGELTHDTTFAAHWLSEAAHVWSTTLGDARRAATLLMRAIDKDPASDVASDRLAGLYREKGDHRALVALYERRAKALAGVLNGDPALAQRLSMLHEDLGRLWQEPPLSQPRKAVENFKKAFEVDPSAVSAIYAARELLKAEGNFKEALPLYDAEIRAIDDTERKLALYRDEASVRQQSGDTKGATQTLRNALQLDPGDTGL